MFDPLESDPFEQFTPPEGFSYQWVTVTVFGDPAPVAYLLGYFDNWTAVPASRHDWPSDDGRIVLHGQLLLERPTAEVRVAEDRARAVAKDQLKVEMANGCPASVPREEYTAALGRIPTSKSVRWVLCTYWGLREFELDASYWLTLRWKKPTTAEYARRKWLMVERGLYRETEPNKLKNRIYIWMHARK